MLGAPKPASWRHGNHALPHHFLSHRDDPTILAWSIANEPRGQVDPSGHTLDRWIEDTSKFVKSQDSNHLVTVDVEGFFLTDQDGEEEAVGGCRERFEKHAKLLTRYHPYCL